MSADGADVGSLRLKAIAQADRGDEQIFIPKRKRGYHRALKRKELWAVNKHDSMKRLNDMTKFLFDFHEIVKPNPFLNMIEKKK